MSDIQLYLFEVDKDKAEAKNVAQRSAQKLETKDLKLIDLITSLEEYINNKDDAAVRGHSIAYLADVLNAVGPRVLSHQERRLLCDFVLGRIEGDVEGIGSSARALLALEKRGKWDAARSQSERYSILQLIDLLLAKYRKPIQELHDQDPMFLPNFIAFFDGEKDPRNLMIVFSLLQVPMMEWDVSSSAQDLFDSVFNYFPITFKPPPDDPYHITAQDLKDRLRDCIAATSDFAPYAFPALLDKLDSSSMNTKVHMLSRTTVIWALANFNSAMF
jgi:DNA repair/transcription protein MET18/MMS19